MVRDLISVIIPAYNAAKFVAEAINSVLLQSVKNVEIICVDDGSTDETKAVIAAFENKVKYIYTSNKGAAAARNIAIRESLGEFVTFLDSDDLYPDGKLERQLSVLKRNDSLLMVAGKVRYVFMEDSADKQQKYIDVSEVKEHLVIGSGLCRKTLFEKVGYFDESLRYGEDSDWYNRINEANIYIEREKEIGLIYRHHASNLTNNTVAVKAAMFQVVKRSLDRKRNVAV